jgi:hypothetical protein
MVRKSVVLSSLLERVTMTHGIRIVIGRFANFCRARFLTRFLHKYVYAFVLFVVVVPGGSPLRGFLIPQ